MWAIEPPLEDATLAVFFSKEGPVAYSDSRSDSRLLGELVPQVRVRPNLYFYLTDGVPVSRLSFFSLSSPSPTFYSVSRLSN